MANNNALQPSKKQYKRHATGAEIVPAQAGDMSAVLNMSIDAMKQNLPSIGKPGRRAVYPDTAAGLQDFKDKSVAFFEYVNEVNANVDDNQTLIPDIETWATYLGITRQSIFNYEKRSQEWADVIQYVKNVITGVKKQLGMHYKIPPVVLMFDLTNNSDYLNSSEFHIKAEDTNVQKKDMTLDEIAEQIGMNPADLDKDIPDTEQADNGSRHGGYDFSDFMNYPND